MRTFGAVIGLFIVGSAFALGQGCGGSTSSDSPQVVTGGAAGTAGASGGTAGTGTAGGGAGGVAGAGGAQPFGGAAGKGGAGGGTAGKGGSGGGSAGKGGSGTAGTAPTQDADLFDVNVPDAPIGDTGTTIAQCYGCATKECKSELQACQDDEKCGLTVSCVLSMCLDTLDQNCILSCAFQSGISSQNDPAVALLFPVFQCISGSCPNDCPNLGMGQGGGGQGGSGSGGTGGSSGSAGASGSAGSGGANQATCQQNIQKCGTVCQGPGLQCFQDSACQACVQTQGADPSCKNNAAFQAVVKCACANPTQCDGCCIQ